MTTSTPAPARKTTIGMPPVPTTTPVADLALPAASLPAASLPAGAPASGATRRPRGRQPDEAAPLEATDGGNEADGSTDASTASGEAPTAATEGPGKVAGADADADAATHQADSCREVHSDGTEEDCHHDAVWPWMIAGAGVLLAGVASAGGHGGDSHAGDSRASAAATPSAPTPPPSPPSPPAPPAPPEAPLPAAPRLSTSSGKDTIDGAGHVDVALASPGGAWVYRIDGDNTWHAGQGSRIDAATLNRGVHAVMVAELDDQGRRGDVATLAVRVHDEVLAPTLTLAHDNGSAGSASNDGLTNDGTIAVSGLAPGATWFYRVNDAADWVQGSGGEVPGSVLVAGLNKVEAFQVDAGGEHGPLSHLTVTLDLTPPDAPVLQTSSGTDLLNTKDFINVSGIEAGASWKFRVNGPGDWIEGQDGRIPATALANGENRLEVLQVDAAGNPGAAATLTVRQDLHAPDMLHAHLEGGRGDLVPLQGSVVLDNLETDATWKYRINGEGDWHVGSGSQLAANYLVEGRNDVALMQTDASGHDSAVSAITVTRDSLAPDRPDLTTSNSQPAINGQGCLLVHRLEDSATWEYRIDGGDWQAGTGDSLAAAALHEGPQTVDVRQTDLAGNVSEVESFAVSVDSVAPDAVLASVQRAGGVAAPDNLINAGGHVSIDGLEPGASWEFKVNGDEHWREGPGTQLATRVLDEGANTVEVRQIDAAGNAGAESTVQLSLDTTPPVIEVTAPNAAFASDSLLQLNGRSSVTVATHGSDVVEVRIGGSSYAFGVDGGASWAADYFSAGQTSNAPAQSTLLITASDKAGNTSTRVLTVRADTIAPHAPNLKLKNDAGSDHSDLVTADGTVEVLGLGSADYLHYSLDNGQHWSDWQSGGEIPGSVFGADGVKNVLVQLTDSYLNLSPTTSLQFTLNSSVI